MKTRLATNEVWHHVPRYCTKRKKMFSLFPHPQDPSNFSHDKPNRVHFVAPVRVGYARAFSHDNVITYLPT